MDCTLLGFDGFFGDSVGGVPYGGDDVRGSGLTLWAVSRGSAFEAGVIVSKSSSVREGLERSVSENAVWW